MLLGKKSYGRVFRVAWTTAYSIVFHVLPLERKKKSIVKASISCVARKTAYRIVFRVLLGNFLYRRVFCVLLGKHHTDEYFLC